MTRAGAPLVYRLSEGSGDAEGGWRLAMTGGTLREEEVGVRLPGASPSFARDTASLSYRSANGSVIVELRARGRDSELDVYVSYELEVNIDAGLSPRVDLLNTNRLLRAVSCSVSVP